MKNYFLVLVILIFFPSVSQAAGASFYFSPGSGGFFVGSTFDVSVFVNTGEENINAVEVNLEFDPTKLQVASPTAGKSFIEVWVAQPAYSNSQGTVSFIGGAPSPGINTSNGLVSTVTFRAVAPGETSIIFLDSSKVLRNDPDGTNILTSKGRGNYQIMIPPPEGPNVFSLTHSDSNKWHKNNNPTFSWDKGEGVTDFSYSFNHEPTTVPDNESKGDYSSVSYGDVADGIWYFHVKAKKAGVWGGTSHFVVQIDAGSPATFEPVIDPALKTTVNQPLVSFITTDALSGIDHYEFKYIDITKDKQIKSDGFFIEVVSPYRLPRLEQGRYLVVIRAYDKAGNWKEGTVKIQIFSGGLSFNKQGIQYGVFILFWWIIILLLIIITILLIYLLSRRYRRLRTVQDEKLTAVRNKFEDYNKRIPRESTVENNEEI